MNNLRNVRDRFISIIEPLSNNSRLTETMTGVALTGPSWPADEEVHKVVCSLDKLLRDSGLGSIELAGDISQSVSLLSQPAMVGESWHLHIRKNANPHDVWFLTLSGFEIWLDEQSSPDIKFVKMIDETESFRTFAFCVSTIGDPEFETASWRGAKNPLKYVQCFGAPSIAKVLDPWLVDVPPANNSPTFEIWLTVASKKLGMLIPHQVEYIDQQLFAVITTPRRRSFPVIDVIVPVDTASEIQEVAKWLYSDDLYVDIKKSFLNTQLSSFSDAENWFLFLNNALHDALKHAIDDFSFYLYGIAKERLTVLSELRKAVSEEADRISKLTSELLDGIWKDLLLVLAGAFATWIPKGMESTNGAIIGKGAAITALIVLLIRINRNINELEQAQSERSKWKQELFAFATHEDFQELVDNTINLRVRFHRKSTWFVVLVEIMVALVLVLCILVFKDRTLEYF